MVAQLYSADLMQVAKPVRKRKVKEEPVSPAESISEESEPPKKERKPRAKKVKVEEVVQEDIPKVIEEKPKRSKKAKAIETAPVEEKEPEEEIDADFEAEIERQMEKQRVKKEKAAARRAAKKQPATPPPEEVKPKKKKERVQREPHTPPAWFTKYVEGVKHEEAKVAQLKKSQKTIKSESQEVAKQRWDDGHTRDRVTHEVDSHMNRMYSMIFGQRRMQV